MFFAIALTDEHWELVADLFDPPGRRGAPAQIPRRQMVDAMLFIGRTGEAIRRIPLVVGIATGRQKANAIRAACAAGWSGRS